MYIYKLVITPVKRTLMHWY